MHRPPDELNPDDWDGTDFAEEMFEPELRLRTREGQGSLHDRERQMPDESYRLESINAYTGDWAEISIARKIAAGYRCTKCGLLLKERWSDLLHTHHINGDKSDNHLGNLLVVCVDCHNKIHGFETSAVPPRDRSYLDALRVQQKIDK